MSCMDGPCWLSQGWGFLVTLLLLTLLFGLCYWMVKEATYRCWYGEWFHDQKVRSAWKGAEMSFLVECAEPLTDPGGEPVWHEMSIPDTRATAVQHARRETAARKTRARVLDRSNNAVLYSCRWDSHSGRVVGRAVRREGE